MQNAKKLRFVALLLLTGDPPLVPFPPMLLYPFPLNSFVCYACSKRKALRLWYMPSQHSRVYLPLALSPSSPSLGYLSPERAFPSIVPFKYWECSNGRWGMWMNSTINRDILYAAVFSFTFICFCYRKHSVKLIHIHLDLFYNNSRWGYSWKYDIIQGIVQSIQHLNVTSTVGLAIVLNSRYKMAKNQCWYS